MNATSLRGLIRPSRAPDETLTTEAGLEGSYRHLFLRELARLGEEDIYFPVGGAANYSLLYIILLIATRLRPESVLDVGCGQTTLLWDRMRRLGHAGSVTTLENDPGWAQEIGRRVSHQVVVSPLRPVSISGWSVDTYDWEAVRELGPFQVIGVDGPVGRPRRSRAGVLQLIDEMLPEDFVIYVDDCERVGEQETVGLIHERLTALDRDYAAGATRAAKTQVVFAGGAFREAVYY